MRKRTFSRILVVFCIGFIVLYTLWCMWAFYRSGQEPPTLTTSVYTFFGAELSLLCFKRCFAKDKNGKDDTYGKDGQGTR